MNLSNKVYVDNSYFLIYCKNRFIFNMLFILKKLFRTILRTKKYETLFLEIRLLYLYIKSKICYNN